MTAAAAAADPAAAAAEATADCWTGAADEPGRWAAGCAEECGWAWVRWWPEAMW
ncbi:hypothetical protein GCM10023235_28090 [Kitasatospora terrestris]|uniref:Uncharacterized protein n=1 Tax=Kitasatospora terrestris TaxID=258051 RepID=A0ABP9DRZ4_9ACTN